MTIRSFEKELRAKANPKKALLFRRYFKTGKGEYGEGDVFLGLTVPEQRKIAVKYRELELGELQRILKSPIHEFRFSALVALTAKYKNADPELRERIVRFYCANTKHINNWDLVDTSAPRILGHYLFDKKKDILYRFARSKSVWERRIAILATHYFIAHSSFKDTFAIAKLLLKDRHDLIHKAVGWMLREVGNRSLETEELFLRENAATMPRTMLRYAIEKFPEAKRKRYLTR